jgi:hypothetical protein
MAQARKGVCLMHFLAAAEATTYTGDFLPVAIIGTILTGLAAIIGVAPNMIRAIREDEADEFRAMIRRVYYFLQARDALDQIDQDLRRDMEQITQELEKRDLRRKRR